MKRVAWTDTGKGRRAPLLPVGVRRRGNTLPVNPILLVDTGADGTVLPRYNAKLLGFSDAKLRPEECGVPGGKIIVHRPADVSGVEMEIDMFRYFDLHMTAKDFALIPL